MCVYVFMHVSMFVRMTFFFVFQVRDKLLAKDFVLHTSLSPWVGVWFRAHVLCIYIRMHACMYNTYTYIYI